MNRNVMVGHKSVTERHESVLGTMVRGATGDHGVVAGVRSLSIRAWKCKEEKKCNSDKNVMHMNVKAQMCNSDTAVNERGRKCNRVESHGLTIY